MVLFDIVQEDDRAESHEKKLPQVKFWEVLELITKRQIQLFLPWGKIIFTMMLHHFLLLTDTGHLFSSVNVLMMEFMNTEMQYKLQTIHTLRKMKHTEVQDQTENWPTMQGCSVWMNCCTWVFQLCCCVTNQKSAPVWDMNSGFCWCASGYVDRQRAK